MNSLKSYLTPVLLGFTLSLPLLLSAASPDVKRSELRVGAAAANIATDDAMAIGGSIFPKYAKGQEGQIRATAVVISEGGTKLCIIGCDVVAMGRDIDDAVAAEIQKTLGIPAQNVLIAATHNHSAPASVTVHSFKLEPVFCRELQEAMVKAATQATENLQSSQLSFGLGQEATVGGNSRLLLSDGTIWWTGAHDDAVRATGPFDPELPVLAFKSPDGKLQALLFNHSTHNIGTLETKRSPAFYGLASQQLESELGGTTMFLIGAAGSSHVVTPIPVDERIYRIKTAVKDTLSVAEPRPVTVLESTKEEFTFHVRQFDEAKEDAAVSYYCRKRVVNNPEGTIENFRHTRAIMAPHQGEARKSWVQVMRIGDIAFVAVPGEYFTSLGMDIKRRSPFRYTYISELANDYIGYIPDSPAFDRGGYQVWTGTHSYVARGTGEAIADEAVRLLNASYQKTPPQSAPVRVAAR